MVDKVLKDILSIFDTFRNTIVGQTILSVPTYKLHIHLLFSNVHLKYITITNNQNMHTKVAV